MNQIIKDPLVTYFCKISIKVLLLYFVVYILSVLAHIPTCLFVVHNFTQQALSSSSLVDSMGQIPFYTPSDIVGYGLSGQLISASFLALLVGTAFFFVCLPFWLLIYGLYPRFWILLSIVLASAWISLGSSPGMPFTVCITLALPSFIVGLFLSFSYGYLRQNKIDKVKPEPIENEQDIETK